MKKSTLALALIFALILSYILLVEKKHPPASNTHREKIFKFASNDITAVQIFKGNQKVELKQTNPFTWEMTQPVHDWADSNACNGLAQAIAELSPISPVEKQENLRDYGLDQQAAILKGTTKSKAAFELKVGSMDPTHEGFYATLPAQEKLFLIPASFGQMLSKPLYSWRDYSLIHFAPEKVTKISIRKKNALTVMEKSGETWMLQSPAKMKADAEKVARLMNKLSFSRLSSFAESNRQFQPELVVQIWETGKSQPNQLLIGPQTSAGFPAKTGGRPATFFVLPDIVHDLHAEARWYKELQKSPLNKN